MEDNLNPIQVVLQSQIEGKTNKKDTIISKAGEKYIDRKLNQRIQEKKKMATYLVENYIEDLNAVAIDAGSTQQQIVECMMYEKNYLSILTNNMTAFRENSNLRVSESANEFILTGGKYVALFDALHGEETLNSFDSFNPNVVIIGVSGFVTEKGFLCHGNDEVKAKKLLFKKKFSKIIIPIDYSKFGKMDSYSFGSLDDFKSSESSLKVIVACPPMAPISEDSESMDLYKNLKERFDKKMEILKSKDVIVDIIPDDFLTYLKN